MVAGCLQNVVVGGGGRAAAVSPPCGRGCELLPRVGGVGGIRLRGVGVAVVCGRCAAGGALSAVAAFSAVGSASSGSVVCFVVVGCGAGRHRRGSLLAASAAALIAVSGALSQYLYL